MIHRACAIACRRYDDTHSPVIPAMREAAGALIAGLVLAGKQGPWAGTAQPAAAGRRPSRLAISRRLAPHLEAPSVARAVGGTRRHAEAAEDSGRGHPHLESLGERSLCRNGTSRACQLR